MTKSMILSALVCMAFAMPAATQHLNAEKGIALQGYDAVAYVSQQKAVKGRSDLNIKHEGVLYYFSTEANRQKFRENRTPFCRSMEAGAPMPWVPPARKWK